MFPKVAGKFKKKIGAACENSNLFYKIFYAVPFFYFNQKLL